MGFSATAPRVCFPDVSSPKPDGTKLHRKKKLYKRKNAPFESTVFVRERTGIIPRGVSKKNRERNVLLNRF